jgi:hypothetical protein
MGSPFRLKDGCLMAARKRAAGERTGHPAATI